jgi:hypothetical protein
MLTSISLLNLDGFVKSRHTRESGYDVFERYPGTLEFTMSLKPETT